VLCSYRLAEGYPGALDGSLSANDANEGNTLRVHPILVLLAVIVGGGLGGIFGVIVAVPSLAVLRVLFDFFRVRLTTED
jgi:hypothetical protein